jgi:hypothetical protein
MSQGNVDLVYRIADAFNRRDLDTYLAAARDRLAGASGPRHRGLYPLIGSSRPAVADVCG